MGKFKVKDGEFLFLDPSSIMKVQQMPATYSCFRYSVFNNSKISFDIFFFCRLFFEHHFSESYSSQELTCQRWEKTICIYLDGNYIFLNEKQNLF